MHLRSLLLLASLMLALCAPLRGAASLPIPRILDGIKADHPRLLVSGSTWSQWKARARTDAEFRALLDATIAAATARLQNAPPERKLQGKRLLFVSRRMLDDVTLFGIAWKMTGERRYLAAAERNLLAVSMFQDWNPSHFLDVGEMTLAVALGYDWLYDDLPDFTRSSLQDAIVRKGLVPGLDSDSPYTWWLKREMNWNQVCLGGLLAGALAVAEFDPQRAGRVAELYRDHAPAGLKPYGPEGIYPEGPGYWGYGTLYSLYAFSAQRSALGAERLCAPPKSFLASAEVQTRLYAPSGLQFNFADCGAGSDANPLLFWFAERLKNPQLLVQQRRHYVPYESGRSGSLNASILFALLHWQTPPEAKRDTWDCWVGRGDVPLAVFQGPIGPAGGVYLGVKGGRAAESHGHMDGGSFIYEVDGVRWAHDLGMQNYFSLESKGVQLFGKDRWKIFRLVNQAHNTLTIDNALHDANGRVSLTDLRRDGVRGVTATLSAALGARVGTAERRFDLENEGRTLVVTDTLAGLKPGARVRWTLITRASVETRKNAARLTSGNKRLVLQAELLGGDTSTIAVSSDDCRGPAEYDAPNEGFTRIGVEFPAPPGGKAQLRVKMETGERPLAW